MRDEKESGNLVLLAQFDDVMMIIMIINDVSLLGAL